jgi:dihydroorotate dehydrogenase electron transfer subunit
MAQEKVRILWNKKIGPSYYYMGLESEIIAAQAKAGQFIMLRASERFEPLLRRPFSIHQITCQNGKPTGIELLYKVVGRNTSLMSKMNMGEIIDIVGPLGKGFTVSESVEKAVIIAGGIGIAPVVLLAAELIRSGLVPSQSRVFLGGRTQEDVLCKEIFEFYGFKVFIATDDGSLGEKGLVTELAERELKKSKPDIIYSCGPHPMLAAVAALAGKLEINCELSIETLMACGLGACLGCAVKKTDTTEKYDHVCIDGPVFNSRDLRI